MTGKASPLVGEMLGLHMHEVWLRQLGQALAMSHPQVMMDLWQPPARHNTFRRVTKCLRSTVTQWIPLNGDVSPMPQL